MVGINAVLLALRLLVGIVFLALAGWVTWRARARRPATDHGSGGV